MVPLPEVSFGWSTALGMNRGGRRAGGWFGGLPPSVAGGIIIKTGGRGSCSESDSEYSDWLPCVSAGRGRRTLEGPDTN